MKIDLAKLTPTARRMAEAALAHQKQYERCVELRKTMTLEQIGHQLGLSRQRVDQILKEGRSS